MSTRRRVHALFFALVVLPVIAACAQLTATEQAGIARDGVRADMCVAKAHACKLDAQRDGLEERDIARRCWPVADECMVGAGLRDAGRTQNAIGGKDASHE